MPGVAPVQARVRMYQVGFGDCFLLSFEYASKLPDGRDERHILIDYGTKKLPWEHFKMSSIAQLIEQHCDELDAIVVTHRHTDHLSALGQHESATIIDKLRPKLIVRSWTEDPDAKPNAQGPVGTPSMQFAASVQHAQSLVTELAENIQGMQDRFAVDAKGQELLAMAAGQLNNIDAINQLDTWAQGRKHGDYLCAGNKTRLEKILPGVRVHVLGPPTIKQHSAVRHEDLKNPEFWMLARGTLEAALRSLSSEAGVSKRPPRRRPTLPPGPARTIVERLGHQQIDMLLNIVRALDGVLNNTSVILLFETGTKRLLFPGDAQIENWEYALDRSDDLKLLRSVDLYKVGHHGSRNATPQRLYKMWKEESHPLVAMMSTKPGFFGHEENNSEVPRATLVKALNELTERRLYRTDELPQSRLYVELEGSLTNDQTFRPAARARTRLDH